MSLPLQLLTLPIRLLFAVPMTLAKSGATTNGVPFGPCTEPWDRSFQGTAWNRLCLAYLGVSWRPARSRWGSIAHTPATLGLGSPLPSLSATQIGHNDTAHTMALVSSVYSSKGHFLHKRSAPWQDLKNAKAVLWQTQNDFTANCDFHSLHFSIRDTIFAKFEDCLDSMCLHYQAKYQAETFLPCLENLFCCYCCISYRDSKFIVLMLLLAFIEELQEVKKATAE